MQNDQVSAHGPVLGASPVSTRVAKESRRDRRPWRTWTRVSSDRAPVPATDSATAEAQPLVVPGPRPTMWIAVSVLVAVLPGLLALRHWDLTPPGPWWGLRGLAVLEGLAIDQVPYEGVGTPIEVTAYRRVAMHPPFYAWLEALALILSGDRAPVATVVPSYVGGLLVVLLVYQLGVQWSGPALGGLAAILVGFNRHLLNHMQLANPATWGLAFALGTLLAHGYAMRAASQDRRGIWLWAVLAGFSLGLSLLSVALFGLLTPFILAGQRLLAGGEPIPPALKRRWGWGRQVLWHLRQAAPTVTVVAVGLAVAAPWHIEMSRRYGSLFWASLLHPPFTGAAIPGGPLERLILLAPATLALAVHGGLRAFQRLRATGRHSADDRSWNSALALAWIATTLFIPLVLPTGSRPVLLLFLLIPLNLLAAGLMIDLAQRRLAIQKLQAVAPLTVLCLAWWACPPLRDLSGSLLRGRLTSSMALGLPLGFGFLVALRQCAGMVDRWAANRDIRRRGLLAGFMALVLGITLVSGIHEVEYRHRETLELLSLREAILRRHSARPFDQVTVLGPVSDVNLSAWTHPVIGPGLTMPPLPAVAPGRLRFVLRSALPNVTTREVGSVEQLSGPADLAQLVVLAGSGTRLSYLAQARLRLESIYPSRGGLLDAYATPVSEPIRPATARR